MIWPWKNPHGGDLGDIVPPDKYDENTINCVAEFGLLKEAGGCRCKLLVYKSGNVKMKIGYFARLGKLNKNVVLSLDLDHVL
ncbi:hypothetical protein R3W88_023667 [Solanum pinnatisectum]|uniref:Uncharacterized protein n=1 Tax=Solanum pinnatisectum TaxID=50273 RepID=A0AAV9M093_9SOLN|nr:hypothetical protein R3W88_023667 [Solanum pinnatisectum]